MIYLTKIEQAIIYSILSQWNGELYAFGSRVKGTHHAYSDLDICFITKIPDTLLSKIKEDFEESNLHFKIDFVDFNQCDESFQKLISSNMIKLPSVQIKQPEITAEWDSYHRIRQEEIFSTIPSIQYNKDHPSLHDQNHYHFFLEIDKTIVGNMHLELRPNKTSILRMIAIAKPYQHRGYGSILICFAHRWLKEHGVYQVLLHARKEVLSFYADFGYKEANFEDPNALPGERIDMTRYLT